jgi:hypothetical protein
MKKNNKEVVLAYVDAFNRGDVDALCALFSRDAMIYGVRGWTNLEKVRPVWQAQMRSTDTSLNVDAIIAEGEVVVVRYTERGKPEQPYCDDPPVASTYETVAMEWFEIRDGAIHRRWCARDAASVFK